MRRLNGQDIEEIYDRAKAHVLVNCDEYHSHSARQGCLRPKDDGDQRDVDICKLVEELRQTRRQVTEVAESLGVV